MLARTLSNDTIHQFAMQLLLVYWFGCALVLVAGVRSQDQRLLHHHNNDTDDEISNNYVHCVKQVCNYYFRAEHAMKGSLVIMNLTPDPTPFMSTIIASLTEDPKHEFSVMVKDSRKRHMNASHVSEKAQNYFMFCGNAATDVNGTVHQWHQLPTWNPQAQVLVLFTNYFDDERLQIEIRSVLSQLLEHSMLNVNVISRRWNTDIVQVSTWFPYAPGNCATDIQTISVIDECQFMDDSSETSDGDVQPTPNIKYHANPKIPKVPRTLHGCPLRVATSIWEPYSFYDTDQKKFTKGIEVLLIKTIAQVLHMDEQFELMSETRENRVADQPSEGYEELINRTIHVLIGGMDEDAHTRKYLSSTIPYYQDDQTWCVAVAKPEDLWRSFFKLFRPIEWLVIVAMIYLIAIILYFISRVDGRHENMHWTLLSSLSITLGLSTVYEPNKHNTRFMFLSFLFYGLIFSSAFHSFLVNVLTNPFQKPQVDNLQSAVANDFAYTGGTVALAHYEGSDQLANTIRRAYRLCTTTDQCLDQLHHSDNLAVSVSREHALNCPVISKSELFCFPKTNNVYSYSVTMLTQRQFHLLNNMNSIIRRVMEFGLIQKWEQDSNTLQQIRLQIAANGAGQETGGEDEVVVLRVDHIKGALILMGGGYALAAITFLAEVLLNSRWIRRPRNWFWRLGDMFLDARRYVWK